VSKLRVSCFGISLDGYGAGPRQSLDNPLGEGGFGVHKWHIETAAFQEVHGTGGGTKGVDDAFERKGAENVGAWIMGRNMFSPQRGAWLNHDWKGWWGDNPPYHVPVFVLTHHARPDLVMDGGTTFHFVTDGIESALKRARQAAGTRDIRLGGGVETIRQYLIAGLIDEMHLAVSPVLLGSGEHLLRDLYLLQLGYECGGTFSAGQAAHMIVRKRVNPDHR
jgi:dihydrofolate reductase